MSPLFFSHENSHFRAIGNMFEVLVFVYCAERIGLILCNDFRSEFLQPIGGDLAAGSPTATLLRLNPSHEALARNGPKTGPH